MNEPLIDCHAHFLHAFCGRSDWQDVNAASFRAGEKIGVTCHVASMLGTYGFMSPTYFPSPDDVTGGNDAMLAMCRGEGRRVRMMVTVNPNHTGHCRFFIISGSTAAASGRIRRSPTALISRVSPRGTRR